MLQCRDMHSCTDLYGPEGHYFDRLKSFEEFNKTWVKRCYQSDGYKICSSPLEDFVEMPGRILTYRDYIGLLHSLSEKTGYNFLIRNMFSTSEKLSSNTQQEYNFLSHDILNYLQYQSNWDGPVNPREIVIKYPQVILEPNMEISMRMAVVRYISDYGERYVADTFFSYLECFSLLQFEPPFSLIHLYYSRDVFKDKELKNPRAYFGHLTDFTTHIRA